LCCRLHSKWVNFRVPKPPTRSRPHFVRAKVTVNRWVDGSWHVFHPTAGELPCGLIEKKDHKAKEVSETLQTEAAETICTGMYDEHIHTTLTHEIKDRASLAANSARQ